MMTLYQLINPSDCVTFYAADQRVAIMAELLVTRGKGAVQPAHEGGESVGFFFMLPDMEEAIQKAIGQGMSAFLDDHAEEVIEALKSFSVASPAERDIYDDAVRAITDPEQLAAFKERHDDRQRTSINQICQAAWQMAAILQKQIKDREK